MMPVNRVTSRLVASLVLAISVSGSAVAQMDDKQAMMDLVIQIQQLQDEVRTLRGMLEEQNVQLESLSNRQRDQYLDLDQRITGLRGSAPAPIASTGLPATSADMPATSTDLPATSTTSTAAAETQPAIREDVPEVRPPLDQPSSVSTIDTPDTQAREFDSSPEAEKAAYDQGFQSLKDLKYADAAEQFTVFVKQFPNSEYADNAQYWLGESYYVTRNYDIALEAFQKLLNDYPDSPKIPDALLKIGYTHYELKQWDQARAALVQVEKQFPDTTLARLASSRLRSMKMEGHY
jgi:tol-pal system protein YbgF